MNEYNKYDTISNVRWATTAGNLLCHLVFSVAGLHDGSKEIRER